MTTDPAVRAVDLAAAAKARPRSEAVMVLVQPLATRLVGHLARLGVDPQHVVWTHAGLGLLAAGLIVVGGGVAWSLAAAALLAKTLLDNVDGGLARATGRVTIMGRYLDTVLDTVVNAALFVALAWQGPGLWAWPLAVGAFLVLTFMLSLDFNLERRYKALRTVVATGPGAPQIPAGAGERTVGAFRRFYDRVLAPQDRAVDSLDEAAFARLAGTGYGVAPLEMRLAWNDLWSSATLVNLGLSTQLTLLALCLAIGAPFAYVAVVYALALYAAGLQAIRAWRFRRFLGAACVSAP